MLKGFHRLLLVSALFLISVSLVASAAGELALDEEVRLRLAEAFRAVADAEEMGGDVSQLVEELNQAVALVEEAEAKGDEAPLRVALSKVEDVIARAPIVGQEGSVAAQTRMVQSGLVIGLVAASAIVVWRYGPRVFWRLWVMSKRGWRVRA